MKICQECNTEKDNNLFTSEKGRVCQDCKDLKTKLRKQQYYLDNKEKIDTRNKKWHHDHKERVVELKAIYWQNNKIKLRPYRAAQQKRRRENPEIKLRGDISRTISGVLKKNESSKQGESILKYLPYTMAELRAHLESLWEPWMNWDNYGLVNSERQTWQIDHIIPQSLLPYKNMTDENFKKSWALDNLRPLEAFENIRKSNKIS